jgi:hypothetical protein
MRRATARWLASGSTQAWFSRQCQRVVRALALASQRRVDEAERAFPNPPLLQAASQKR